MASGLGKTGIRAVDASSSQPTCNALTVFAAHFHVRRGNEIVWAQGLHTASELTTQGLEWKVLPSGSHLLDSDVFFFGVQPRPQSASASSSLQHGHLVGVAAFKNRKIEASERASATGQDDDDQRGARMVAVGAIVDCGSKRTPWTQLAATLPHVCQLERLADAVSADPSCRGLLEEWLEIHKRRSPFITTSSRDVSTEGPFYAHDPLLMLPAVSNALGPLLPGMLKRLLAAPFRLLIYAPHGASSLQAASIAFNLGEIVHSACQSSDIEGTCPVVGRAGKSSEAPHERTLHPAHGLDVLGVIGLHDIAALQEKATNSKEASSQGWIAWTSDRILLEKPSLYDAVLDLSPLMAVHKPYSSSSSSSSATRARNLIDSTVLPHLWLSGAVVVKNGKSNVKEANSYKRCRQTWTTREFAVYRGMDERASFDATTSRQARRAVLGRRQSQSSLHMSASTSQMIASRRGAATRSLYAHTRPSTSTLLAFLTYWLSSLRILPERWRLNLRESYGYVPLSIRSDGGIRASIMLLPSDDEDEESESEGEEEEEDGSEVGDNSTQHLCPSSHRGVSPTHSPRPKRRLLGDDTVDAERDEYLDDPIMAAVGASSMASKRRHSRSLGSRSNGSLGAARIVSEVGSLHDDARAGSPETPFATSPSGDDSGYDSRLLERQSRRDAREGVRLALCQFVCWSEWTGALVSSVQDMVQERVNDQEVQGGREQTRNDTGAADVDDEINQGRPLLPIPAKEATTPLHLVLHSKDLASVGLSSSNAADADLVRFLASGVTDLPVEVPGGWTLLSWLCW